MKSHIAVFVPTESVLPCRVHFQKLSIVHVPKNEIKPQLTSPKTLVTLFGFFPPDVIYMVSSLNSSHKW